MEDAGPLRDVGIAAFLALATLVLYAPAGGFAFLNFDDDVYVTEAQHVREGLTLDGLRWALASPHGPNWHPATTLSHMLDVELFGLDARWHHRVSIGLHALNAALAFVALLRLTRTRWPSALAAALFALHPLRAESVAWVAERKDVLSGCFFFLTLIAYAGHARRPGARRLALVALLLAAGLLAKPMLVTVPFVLLLLDAWPLGRVPMGRWTSRAANDGSPAARATPLVSLLAEKLPLLALALVASVVTVQVQRTGGAFAYESTLPLAVRAGNAIVSYVVYLRQSFWPTGLGAFYPYRAPGAAEVASATVLLAAITLGSVLAWRRRPYLLVGWLWYVGMLVPVIGFVQVGEQARADRYTYLPSVGIFVMLAWLAAEVAGRSRAARAAVVSVAVALLLALGWAARVQVGFWRDTETVFRRALAVTEQNHLAHVNLGVELLRLNRPAEAAEQFQGAVRARSGFPRGHLNLGIALTRLGDLRGAVTHHAEAVRLGPADPVARRLLALAHDALARSLEKEGRSSEAIEQYRAVLPLLPEDWRPSANLAVALASAGRRDEAVLVLNEARRRWPDEPALAEELARLQH